MHLLKGILPILHNNHIKLCAPKAREILENFVWKMRKYSGKLTEIVQYCGKLTFQKKHVHLGGKLRISKKLAGELSVISPLRGGY